MAHPVKIATCCYCGARAALTLPPGGRHELACATCGAPLHSLRQIRTEGEKRPKAAARPAAHWEAPKPAKKAKAKTPKRSKPPRAGKLTQKIKRAKKGGLWRKALGEAFDAIEDLF